MVARRALVLDGGRVRELPAGDTLLGDGAASLAGTATITLPNGNGELEHTETVAAPGVLDTDLVLPWLAAGTDADENTADMIDLRNLSALAGVDEITFTITLSTPLSGPVLINWKVF